MKSCIVRVVLKTDTENQLRKLSKKEGLSMSGFLRHLLMRRLQDAK